MKKLMMSAILFAGLSFAVKAQQGGMHFIEDKTWDELLTEASKTNKLIFLDCYAVWCGPCKAMAKDVFPLPKVGEFMNKNFILTKRDMEKGEGIDLHKKYKQYIPGFPTYLLINGKGEVMHQAAGYMAEEKFITNMTEGLEQRSWLAMSNRYDNGERSWEFLADYLTKLETAFQTQKINAVSKEALSKLTPAILLDNAAAYAIFKKYWKDAEDPLFKTVAGDFAISRKHKDMEKDFTYWTGNLYRRAVDAYVSTSIEKPNEYNRAKANTLLNDLISKTTGNREHGIALMRISNAAVDKNVDQFIQLVSYAKQFGMLRYNGRQVGSWAKNLSNITTDKNKLKTLLSFTEYNSDEKFLSPEEIKNYAFLLNKLGEKEKAKAEMKKAEETEKKIKESFEKYMKK